MNERFIAVPRVEQEFQKSRHCLILPGIFAANEGMQAGIGAAYAEKYGGTENVTVFNSIVTKDKLDPQRFEKMAATIKEHAATGLDIVLHSMGTTEFWHVMQLMKKQDPDFFDPEKNPQVKDNLRIVAIGASGASKGIKERIMYPLRELRDVLSHGMHAQTAFPSQSITNADIARLLPHKVNQSDMVRTVPLHTEENEAYLTKSEKAVWDHYEGELRKAVDAESPKRLRKALRQRGRALQRPYTQIFEGTPVVNKSAEKTTMSIGGFTGLKLLLRANGKKPMEELIRLADFGYDVSFNIPQYDKVVPVKRLARFLKGREAELVTIVEGSSHPGFALQAGGWATVTKGSGNDIR